MKSTVLAIVLSCAVATTLASYEQLVSEAIGDVWTAGLRESRHRRDVEEKNLNTSEVEVVPTIPRPPWCFCGKKSWMQSFVEKNDDVVKNCVEEYIPLLNQSRNGILEKRNFINSIATMSQCTIDCTFKKTNLTNSEGKLDKSNTKKYFMDNVFFEDWIKNIAEKALDQCLNNGSSFSRLKTMVPLTAPEEKTCNNEPYKFNICLMSEMVKDCPEDHKSKDSVCQLLYFSLDMMKKMDQKEQ